jgi:pyruvate/2-oxoglutarate dehydrogenase complex dihydrolipoamide dehydrogenase (E3) component
MALKVGVTVRESLLRRLSDKGVSLLPGVQKYKEITERGLILIDSKGKTRIFEADTIVIATGSSGKIDLYNELKNKVKALYAIGDCVEPRDIKEAITEGAKVGTLL